MLKPVQTDALFARASTHGITDSGNPVSCWHQEGVPPPGGPSPQSTTKAKRKSRRKFVVTKSVRFTDSQWLVARVTLGRESFSSYVRRTLTGEPADQKVSAPTLASPDNARTLVLARCATALLRIAQGRGPLRPDEVQTLLALDRIIRSEIA